MRRGALAPRSLLRSVGLAAAILSTSTAVHAVSHEVAAAVRTAGSGKTRITAISIFDQGSSTDSTLAAPLIDTTQGICEIIDQDEDGVPESIEYEPFFDTIAGLTVYNRAHVTLTISRVYVIVARYQDTARSFRGRKLSPISIAEIGPGKSVSVQSLMLAAIDGSKYLNGVSSATTISDGFHDMTFVLEGRYSTGRRVTLKAKTTLSFAVRDRCSS